MSDPFEMIRLDQINKRFGGVQALRDVSFSINRGEIHAIVGENGAGKSTLMKILAGIYQPDSGQIWLRGEPVSLGSPLAARAAGVSIVSQELALFPHLSIAANVFVNREATRGGILDKSAMRSATRQVLDLMGVSLDPARKVSTLTVGEKQLVEIARTLQQQSEIVIMDEPNSALNSHESERLFAILRRLREQGLTIIYVSHRLEEVFAISDRITVVRDGQYQGTWNIGETTIPRVISAMIGRHLDAAFPDRDQAVEADAPVVLSISSLAVEPVLHDVSFDLRAGEILGIAGLEGSGISEIFEVLFGLRMPSSGQIVYSDGRRQARSPFQAIRQGLALVPANRREEGLMTSWSIRRNTSVAVLDRLLLALGVIDQKSERNLARDSVQRLNIATDSIDKQVVNLSGGNQQKVVLAKWMASGPTILLLNDPTRGVDVGAKAEIYHLCDELARQGLALLFTSSELEETIGVSDRIIVMYRGRSIREFGRGAASKADLTFWASGGGSEIGEHVLEQTG